MYNRGFCYAVSEIFSDAAIFKKSLIAKIGGYVYNNIMVKRRKPVPKLCIQQTCMAGYGQKLTVLTIMRG